jgi:hypothetical protein
MRGRQCVVSHPKFEGYLRTHVNVKRRNHDQYDNDKVKEYDYGLTPGVKPNPSHAREHCTDEKAYPHLDLEEHNY